MRIADLKNRGHCRKFPRPGCVALADGRPSVVAAEVRSRRPADLDEGPLWARKADDRIWP
jgi:hypothetical protein